MGNLGWKTGEQIFLFGNFPVYPFTMLIGIISSILTILYFWKKNRFPIEVLLTLIIITIPTAIIGARLFWIIEEAINHNTASLKKWYAIWEGGLSIQGGVLIPTVADLLYLRSKRKVVDIRKAFGIIVPTILIGQAIGRWGNFTNHELYGAEVSKESIMWLGAGIAGNMYIDGAFRLPLFLVESIINFIGYILIVWVFLQFNWFKPGTTGGIYFVWYGVTRTALEPLRNPADFEFWYLILAIISIIAGLILIVYFEITGRKMYQKIQISKHSYYYYNEKVKVFPINISSRWINE